MVISYREELIRLSTTKEITEVRFTATDVPEGLEVSTSGVVTGTPTDNPGTYQMQIGATTNYGQDSKTVTVNLEGSDPSNEPEPDPEP